MRVLLAVHDVRVRRALSRLLELNGHVIAGAAEVATLLPQLDTALTPDVVLLELDHREQANDLGIVQDLAQRGVPVIALSSGLAPCTSVLAAGAQACLDKDVAFSDRLAAALREVVPRGRAPRPTRRDNARPSD